MPTHRTHKKKPEAGKMGNPEQDARRQIDRLLVQAGWHVCDADQTNITAHRGVAIREFPLPGHGFADYLLYVDGKAAGVIEAKKEGVTLSGVETQSAKYTQGLPPGLPCWHNPLPFAYQSTGVETRFTNFTEKFIVQRLYSMLKGRDLLSDLHAKDGDTILSRSTYPVTSLHC